jgi:hypothetical protein
MPMQQEQDDNLCRLGQALVYKKIRQAVGIKNVVVSGGGSLATHLDDFFEVLGLQVINGWGLSEVRNPPPLPPGSHPGSGQVSSTLTFRQRVSKGWGKISAAF